MSDNYWDKPLAVAPFTSYRYKGHYGYIMIGARDELHALDEASRSLSYGPVRPDSLEVWNGSAYVAAFAP